MEVEKGGGEEEEPATCDGCGEEKRRLTWCQGMDALEKHVVYCMYVVCQKEVMVTRQGVAIKRLAHLNRR